MLFLRATLHHAGLAKGATAATLADSRCHRFRSHYFCPATLSHLLSLLIFSSKTKSPEAG